ncbi:MAG: MBL fold metallo-hydrolase [Synergistaceae bacterium]|nr:MBL fold metallo-hydrolase [Synergistaceae bacterium]MBQ6111024.1 MBL fold metallo-hydrolase [Synergistaceae bacterium]MBQ9629758.1 MBL fold metallo-hydrolase [Synergistaceae bacterium]MBR0068910.1 MBL fold metallo-hydrolase [Synergistaceae bacterium]MBR0250230.1 MBL fold metallo-hydrolase [Synergistaceae bacterium]
MEIKVVKLFKGGEFNEEFLFGGENKADGRKDVMYPGSLQNFLIDTGDEVILVDTGFPAGTPFKGYTKIMDYVPALEALGYKPEQVSKILITHKHADHSGSIGNFPNAKIYIGPEDADAMKLTGDNIVRATYSDGAYHNFPQSQKIADGVYFIKARGHTNGNSIVIAEKDGVYYMMHGDVTYVDAALHANKLSIVFEDLAAARETLDRVREFVKNNPTIYLSTHTPEGVKNLEEKIIMKLD